MSKVDGANLDGDAWLTTHEAADIIGCGERKVLRLIEQGHVEAKKDGHVYLVSLGSARAYKRSVTHQNGKKRANGEGSVYESPKGSGKWKVALTVKVNGKSKLIRRNVRSQKAGLALRDKLKAEYRQEGEEGFGETEQENLLAEPPLVREVCDEWVESISQARKENTVANYKLMFRLNQVKNLS